MPYIKHIALRNCRNIESLDIDLTPGDEVPFRHLILTGPNGSGKTGALEAIVDELQSLPTPRSAHLEAIAACEKRITEIETRFARGEFDKAALDRLIAEQNGMILYHKEQLQRRSARLEFDTDAGELLKAQRGNAFVLLLLEALRQPAFQRAVGPTNLADVHAAQPRSSFGQMLVQFLVNRKADQAFAITDGDHVTADQIGDWFTAIEKVFAVILNVSELNLRLDRQSYMFWFESNELPHRFNVHQLASGWLASLYVLGEILLRVDAIQRAREDFNYEPPGIVIIDEIEAHLHLRLQERILPLLTTMFPKIQFIVATHSPAVISSIPNAVVHDLGSGRHYLSDTLQGIRYGDLMTSHFGIESDLDLDSTRRLERLKALALKERRTAEEDDELRRLAGFLSERSHTLALEVWNTLEDESHDDGDIEPGAKVAS